MRREDNVVEMIMARSGDLVALRAAAAAEYGRRLAKVAEADLHVFLREFAWPVLWPGTPFMDNWHIHAICDHLQAVTDGKIQRLIISMPFRSLKSTLVSQTWPAWEWISKPWLAYLTASYAKDLAMRDAVDSRRIIESPRYQAAFGDRFRMTGDQNVKTRYENDKRGMRVVTSTDAGATGFGGDRRIIDDPISAKEADSAVAINASIEFWKGTMATRGNDPASDAVVVVHQRVNERDLTGHLLAEETGWDHLVLPMRYDPEKSMTTSLGFVDPRKVKGELLHAERVDEAAVTVLEGSLGAYHTAAQLNQDPASRGGIIFARKDWKFYLDAPAFQEVVISVDCTFKDAATSDYVAIQAWGRKGADKYLLHRVREHLGFAATVIAVRAVKALFPQAIAVLIEDKANGSAVIETLSREIPGVVAIQPEGGKAARAYAMQPEHEAGNLYLPDPKAMPGVEIFLTEVSGFDGLGTKHDDETDAMTQAVNWFRMRRGMGLYDFMRQGAEALAAAKKGNGSAIPAPDQSGRAIMEAIR
jgi:predicted phage terminase large subunit-like protein